jgi:hypothetical protein
MFKEETTEIMNEKIRSAIRQRAQTARSKDEVVQAVFETFRAAQIDYRRVSLEDMKSALVEATRAAHASRDLPDTPMPA